MADKARGRDQTFNWETATYVEEHFDDLDSFIDFETDFPAIMYNDASTSYQNISSEPTKHTPYPRLDELNDHCPTLTNTPYPHQRYAVYNTLVNEE
nr:hypothetical protein [Tanacetum cinerariifolium]